MKDESQFHSAFKLQGESFKYPQELIDFSLQISFEVHTFLKEWFNEHVFVEVKTSGSTGKQKVIQLQKKYMIQSAKATGEYFKLPENTTALLCMSPNYIAGKMMLVRSLALGWHLDVIKPISNPLKGSNKQYDFSAMVPMQLHNSLTDIYKIKKLIVGGGIVSKELVHKIKNLKTEIFATYGMTETITHIAVKRLNNFKNIIASEMKKSHYQTLPNVAISKDSRGCLVIEVPTISEKKIITNDVVELISSTEFKWLGRFDTIINSGGIKLIPEQIEEKLAEIITQRFFVAGISNEILGEKLILIMEGLVTQPSRSEKDVNLISTSLNHRKKIIFDKIKRLPLLLKYEIPKEIYFVEQFIETVTKKINRNETLKLIGTI